MTHIVEMMRKKIEKLEKENNELKLSNENYKQELILLKQSNKLVEEQLKILQNTPNTMGYIFEKWSINPEDCKFSYCSDISNIIYEISPEYIINNPMAIINQILPEYVKSFIYSVEESYRTLCDWSWIGGIKTASGKIKYLKCQSKPYLDTTQSNKYVKWYGAVLDVTETYNSNLEYENLINTANAPIVGSDSKLHITIWNKKLETLTGFQQNDMLGKNIIDFIIENKKLEVEHILKETLIGIEKSNYELPFTTKEGNIIDLIINSTARRDIQDNIVGVIGIGQDFTELKVKTAEQIKLNEETKLLHTAVSSCMHELKNPEHVVSMTLEELEDNIKSIEKCMILERKTALDDVLNKLEKVINHNKDDILNNIKSNITKDIKITENICNELKHNIQTIRNCTEHKIKILGNMLSITKLELNELILKNEELDLFKVCNNQIDMVSKVVNKDVKVELICPKINILADEKHLCQILTNLLSNASKIVKTGYIKLEIIEIKKTEEIVILDFRIIDTGCGILDEQKNKLLKAERFKHGGFRHGTGIGLCITIDILKLMSSKLEIKSPIFNTEENKGSMFSFKVQFNLQKKHEEQEEQEELIEKEKINVLIVDDLPANRLLLQRQLKKNLISFKERNVEVVESGEKCLEYIKSNKVEVIIMDEVMTANELLGSETVKKIRELDYKMKIIHCSGNSCTEDIDKYIQAGSDIVVGKPLPIKEMNNIIYKLLY